LASVVTTTFRIDIGTMIRWTTKVFFCHVCARRKRQN